MKKTILIALLAVLCLSVSAQIKDTIGFNLPIVNGTVIYEQVVDIPNKTKDELYKNAKLWFVNTFKSAKNVLQNDDKSDGEIIGKGNMPVYWKILLAGTQNAVCNFAVQIDCKANKYRYKIYSLSVDFVSSTYTAGTDYNVETLLGKVLGTAKCSIAKSVCKSVLKSLGVESQNLIGSIKNGMAKQADDF
jgi:ABC-type long-subunit fatty acid transport system fused permease/ATPase subunit